MGTTNSNTDLQLIITASGSAIPDTIGVVSVQVNKHVNRIPVARITLLDGDAETGDFPVSSSSTFVPGTEVTIAAGYGGDDARMIFSGMVTKQSIRVDARRGSTLEIECRDKAVKMTVGRNSQVYNNKTDSDIISSIIGKYDSAFSVSSTATNWPSQVQHYVTDWDFIISRAEMNGMIVIANNGSMTVAPPDANTTSVLTAAYGDGLLELNADLDAVTQLANVTASAWDYTAQAINTSHAGNSTPGPGNISSRTLAEVIGLDTYQVQTTAPVARAGLTDWAKAAMVKSTSSKITGSATLQGTSLAEPGKYMTLNGLGDRFSGDHLISGVAHTIADGNWITTASIGLPAGWFIERPDVMAPPASGMLPGARGLMNGTVKSMYQDPDAQYRVLVSIPMFSQSGGNDVWARLSNFYATSGAGAFFMPEVGDEVVIGFFNEDPRYPVILGSIYSSAKMPYRELGPNAQNSLKAIVSRSGIQIQFDDEHKVLTIATPGNNKVTISDKDKQIAITDENGNSIELSQSGIKLNSPKNIEISADQQLVLSGGQGVRINASGGDVAISGINIKETADAQYTAEGSLTAKVVGGTELTLKGAMVLIN